MEIGWGQFGLSQRLEGGDAARRVGHWQLKSRGQGQQKARIGTVLLCHGTVPPKEEFPNQIPRVFLLRLPPPAPHPKGWLLRMAEVKERHGTFIPIITPHLCLHLTGRTSPPSVSYEVQERPSYSFHPFCLFCAAPACIARRTDCPCALMVSVLHSHSLENNFCAQAKLLTSP